MRGEGPDEGEDGVDNSEQPLFRQIAGLLEDSIVDGNIKEGAFVPSTNELARFHSVNPATVRRGFDLPVQLGVIEKHRGLGMVVTQGARVRILDRRRDRFAGSYVAPLVDEALRLGVSRAELHDLLDRVGASRGMYA